ncbi:helix-turn-helix domain-containing protein [Gammaproteobacteria bacterium]|nr:helix-turn-helix domain-containing protein [Gammaproteobacteria bacterium]
MKTDSPQDTNGRSQQAQGPAVVLFELTDPSAAGEDIEILDQDVVHLGAAPFSARRVVVNLDKSMFVYHAVSHRIRTRTRLHPALMPLMIVGPTSRATIDGREMDSTVLVAGEPGVEVEIVVQDEYESMTLMISPDEFTQHLRQRGREEAVGVPRGIEMWHSSEIELRELFNIGKRLAESATNEPALLNDLADVRAAAHKELLEWYLAALQMGKAAEPSRIEQTSQRYSRIVKTAQEYVMEQHDVGYSVTDLCEVTNTSERTLQYAFRKILGMTPIEYLIRLRLHRAHQDLRTASPESNTVSKIAVNWGFWHFGEFSTAYRSCFDEMPSETLNQQL